MRLLVVEDDPRVGRFITQGLVDEGYEVVWATTGDEAIGHVRESSFDFILLCQTLPDRDGLEMARSIRARGIWAPILMIIRHDTPAEREVAVAAGANDVLGKPFRFADLLSKIQSMPPE